MAFTSQGGSAVEASGDGLPMDQTILPDFSEFPIMQEKSNDEDEWDDAEDIVAEMDDELHGQSEGTIHD
jgi:hypothetical protein